MTVFRFARWAVPVSDHRFPLWKLNIPRSVPGDESYDIQSSVVIPSVTYSILYKTRVICLCLLYCSFHITIRRRTNPSAGNPHAGRDCVLSEFIFEIRTPSNTRHDGFSLVFHLSCTDRCSTTVQVCTRSLCGDPSRVVVCSLGENWKMGMKKFWNLG